MDLGATVCTRSSPDCAACPVADDCVALREDRIATLPTPRPRKALPHRELRVLLIERGGEILFERRPPLGIWGGLWSLPELSLDADVRASIKSRYAAEVVVRDSLPTIAHGFTHFSLTLHPQCVTARHWPLHAEAPGIAMADARRCAGRRAACADQETDAVAGALGPATSFPRMRESARPPSFPRSASVERYGPPPSFPRRRESSVSTHAAGSPLARGRRVSRSRRHSREGGNPESFDGRRWVPACAGTTRFSRARRHSRKARVSNATAHRRHSREGGNPVSYDDRHSSYDDPRSVSACTTSFSTSRSHLSSASS